MSDGDIYYYIQENKGYGPLEYFFFASEFVFGLVKVQETMLKEFLPPEAHFPNSLRFWEPFCIFVCLFAVDSYFGKLLPIVFFTIGAGAIQIYLLVVACTNSMHLAPRNSIDLAITFFDDVLRPVRWALMYSSRPNMPFRHMRRFIILIEAAYLFGKFAMTLIRHIPSVQHSQHIPVVFPVVLLVEWVSYAVIIVLVYKKTDLASYFEPYAARKMIVDVACTAVKTVGKKRPNLQSKLQDRPHNKALCVGFVVTIAVLLPYSVTSIDSELVKLFVKTHRDFLAGSTVRLVLDVFHSFITGVFLLLIEFVFTCLLERCRLRPYYIFWMTFAFMVVLTSAALMTVLSGVMSKAIPYPVLPEGKAHLTIFNCLPGSIEVEWIKDKEVNKIRNLDYARKILIDVDGEIVKQVVILNRPIGKYWPGNVTIIEGKENVYVVNYDGIFRANISESMTFDRMKNRRAQLRILDCFEVCCHGNVKIAPEMNQGGDLNPITVELSKDLLSARQDLREGAYSISYQPTANVSLQLGTLELHRLDKVVLILNSFKHPKFAVHYMVNPPQNTGLYVCVRVLLAIFRISPAYEKMVVVYLTDRSVFSFMLGIDFILFRLANILSLMISEDNWVEETYSIVMGISSLSFIIYITIAVKFKSHFKPGKGPRHKEDESAIKKRRITGVSNLSGVLEPNKEKDQ